MKKEWRVFVKGIERGNAHYIIADSKQKAIAIDRKEYPFRKHAPLNATLWKTGKGIYDLNLTPTAQRRIGVIIQKTILKSKYKV